MCNFTLIDLATRSFLDIPGRVIEFYDHQVTAKGPLGSLRTLQGARTISLFPTLGIISSEVEAAYYVSGRGAQVQGGECSVPAQDLMEQRPLERLAPQPELTLTRSFSATANLDVAFASSIFLQNSTDGKRQYYGGQRLSYAQVEQKGITDPDAPRRPIGEAFSLDLVQYGSSDSFPVAFLTGVCATGVPYSMDDFYEEFPDGVVTLPGSGGAARDAASQPAIYGHLGDIPWHEIAQLHAH
jgi:hypothetical protein